MTLKKEYYSFRDPIIGVTLDMVGETGVLGFYTRDGNVGSLAFPNPLDAANVLRQQLLWAVVMAEFDHGICTISDTINKRRLYVDGHSLGSSKTMPRILTFQELESELTQLKNAYIDATNGTSEEENT